MAKSKNITVEEHKQVHTMRVELWAITPDAEALIERAGRVCWRTELSPIAEGRTAFIEALIRRGHLSVIEHPAATFKISGISRACSHQIVRHRLASYSQESMRYVDMGDQSIVVPPVILANEATHPIWQESLRATRTAYRNLRAHGVRKEDARFVLPIATTTQIVMTQNFTSWRHFIELRCNRPAQWEIRQVAHAILKILYREAPAVFGDLVTLTQMKETDDKSQ